MCRTEVSYRDLPIELREKIAVMAAKVNDAVIDASLENNWDTAIIFIENLRKNALICRDHYRHFNPTLNNLKFKDREIKNYKEALECHKDLTRAKKHLELDKSFDNFIKTKNKLLFLEGNLSSRLPHHIGALTFFILPKALIAISINALQPLIFIFLVVALIAFISAYRQFGLLTILFLLSGLITSYLSFDLSSMANSLRSVTPFLLSKAPFHLLLAGSSLFFAYFSIRALLILIRIAKNSAPINLILQLSNYKEKIKNSALFLSLSIFLSIAHPIKMIASLPLIMAAAFTPICILLAVSLIMIPSIFYLSNKWNYNSFLSKYVKIIIMSLVIATAIFSIFPLINSFYSLPILTTNRIIWVVRWFKALLFITLIQDLHWTWKYSEFPLLREYKPKQLREQLKIYMADARQQYDLNKNNSSKIGEFSNENWFRDILCLYSLDHSIYLPTPMFHIKHDETFASFLEQKIEVYHHCSSNAQSKISIKEIIEEVLDKYAPVNQAIPSPAQK